MKAFREERKTMHTKRALRWASSVAVLTATAVGAGAPLALPASAATETLVAVAEQPRYPVNSAAVFDVTVTNPVVGDQLGVTIVSGPDQPAPSTSCTTISAQGTATCTVRNTRGAGTDRITVNDPTTGAVSAQAAVSFESMTATADQNVGTVGAPTYLYGANQTANISVTVTGAATTPNLKAIVTSGPDLNAQANCVQSTSLPGNWNCALTNNGKGGADVVTVFDDDNPVGTTAQADTNEASTTLTLNFELLTVTPATPRSQTQAAGTAKINVAITGRPAAWSQPKIRETITGAQYSSQGTCTSAGDANTWTCTVVNSGRADSGTVKIFDDLDGDTTAGPQEPQATTPVNFEKLNVTDSNGPGHSTGSTATLSVTADGTPQGQSPSISYFIQCGPDASPASVCPETPATPVTSTTVQICPGSGPWTCSIVNHGTSGTDRIWVFDDANNNGIFDGNAGEPNQMFDVAFGDSVIATPKSIETSVTDANNSGSGVAAFSAVATVATGTSHLRYTVTSGPDANAAHTAQSCTPLNGGTTNWTCTITNGTTATNGAAGVDTVLIFNDTNNDGVNQPAEKTDTVKATFDKPTAISLSPSLAPGQHQAQVAVNGCQAYTLTVSPTAVKFPAVVQFQKNLGQASAAPASQLSACNVPNGSVVSVSAPAPTSSGGGIFSSPTWTQTVTIRGDTNQDPLHPGQLIVGIKSSGAGTVNVQGATGMAVAANNLPATSVQTLTVVAGGQTAVRTLSVTPASVTLPQGGTQAFTVLAQDANGTPLPDTTVQYVVAAGSPDATTAAVTCLKADQFGKATCSLTNNRNVGVDRITFFAPQASGETAPAANDPQTTATATVQATPPAGSTLTFGCPDELLSDANQIVPACTVSTGNGGARQIIFAAHVADSANAPLANIPVTFTLTNSPAGSTATATQVNTNAKGNALFVVSVPSPAAGNKITVQAAVGSPSAGGLGPDTAVATFQSPRPSVVSVTPTSQRVSSGGLVNLTGRVTDQFGAGVSGHVLSWAVSGRNSDQGTVTTNSNGTGAFSYVDGGGSGSDTVSVLDTSPNAPNNSTADAVVTFGSGGGCTGNCCTTNCGGGRVEAPTLKVTQSPAGRQEKLKLKVTSHPKLVDAKVIFYSVSKSGARHKIGTAHTGGKGTVTGTLKSAHGLHLRFQAKVVGRAGVKSGYSSVVKVHVQ